MEVGTINVTVNNLDVDAVLFLIVIETSLSPERLTFEVAHEE